MRLKSFAKINLGIEVLGKREDGYHEIRTLFQTISLFDLLTFLPATQNEILLKGNDPGIPWDGSNLIYKAASLMKERFAIRGGVEIQVIKNIPAGKGLGGGSSNAAVTLMALNEIWAVGLEKEVLLGLGAMLGSDVPYFFTGGLCLGLGRGEELHAQEDLDSHLCVLAFPAVSIETASVYRQVSPPLTSRDKDSKIIKFLDSRDLGFLENDLEEIVFRKHPQIKTIKGLIQEQGSELTLMSGSGSAVFGLFRQKDKADKAQELFSGKTCSALVTTLSRSDYWKKMRTGV
jgi:4-diphosphocytidyl-2-C-methyl-D-erythritol kinase